MAILKMAFILGILLEMYLRIPFSSLKEEERSAVVSHIKHIGFIIIVTVAIAALWSTQVQSVFFGSLVFGSLFCILLISHEARRVLYPKITELHALLDIVIFWYMVALTTHLPQLTGPVLQAAYVLFLPFGVIATAYTLYALFSQERNNDITRTVLSLFNFMIPLIGALITLGLYIADDTTTHNTLLLFFAAIAFGMVVATTTFSIAPFFHAAPSRYESKEEKQQRITDIRKRLRYRNIRNYEVSIVALFVLLLVANFFLSVIPPFYMILCISLFPRWSTLLFASKKN